VKYLSSTRKSKPYRWLAIVASLLMAWPLLGTVPTQSFGDNTSNIRNDNANETSLANTSDRGGDALLEQRMLLSISVPEDDTAFQIPTCGYLNGSTDGKSYNWAIEWGDGSTEESTGQSSFDGGIGHTYQEAGEYEIVITPNGTIEAWLGAFGFGIASSGSAAAANKAMLIGAPCLLTPEMTRNTEQINGTQKAPSHEWSVAFFTCPNLVEAPSFAGWEGIDTVNNDFAANMFTGCTSLAALPEDFNLPPDLTEVADNFANSMFSLCSQLSILPSGFNLPQGITSTGMYFANGMFYACSELASLPEAFNLPQGVVATSYGFAGSMFYNCESLDAMPGEFNLPQGINDLGSFIAGSSFASYMFYGAGSGSFQINDVFVFPANIPADSNNAFYQTFQLSPTAPIQNRTAESIIGDCPVPINQRQTFNTRFWDLDYIPVNWGGRGIKPPDVGAPGSGDINGDGLVTMDEVVITLRASISEYDLTPEQLAAIDMDFDGQISMADVILVLRKTI